MENLQGSPVSKQQAKSLLAGMAMPIPRGARYANDMWLDGVRLSPLSDAEQKHCERMLSRWRVSWLVDDADAVALFRLGYNVRRYLDESKDAVVIANLKRRLNLNKQHMQFMDGVETRIAWNQKRADDEAMELVEWAEAGSHRDPSMEIDHNEAYPRRPR